MPVACSFLHIMLSSNTNYMWGENAEPPCLGLQASQVCRQVAAKLSSLGTSPHDLLEKYVSQIHSITRCRAVRTQRGKKLQQGTIMNFTTWISMRTLYGCWNGCSKHTVFGLKL